MGKFATLLVVALLLPARQIMAGEFFVSPAGQPSGDGSIDRPWDLGTALGQPRTVKPGDTIWLRGGTYTGHFRSVLTGERRLPIVVRQYRGERATLDGNDGTNSVTLLIVGSDAWYWGFEITNSNPTRTSADANQVPGRGEAVNLLGNRTRLINLVIHDTSQGVLTTTDIENTEISGCLIYYNGYDGTDRGHGHGIYIQNAASSSKQVFDNVIFDQFGIGIHAYTESGQLDDLDFEGNTSFDNGALSLVTGLTTNVLVGASGSPASSPTSSSKVAKNTVIRGNATYFSTNGGIAANLGYSKGIASPIVQDNYFSAESALALINAFRPITMNGNTFYGGISGFTTSEFPDNAYFSARPTGANVFVRPNRYEYGRAHITIYNWDRASAVDVSLQGVLPPGTHFELRNAQNYYAPPVLAGVYAGLPLHVPMDALPPATPVGRPAPAPTGPDFQVFVLVPTSSAETARSRPTRPAGPAFAPPATRTLPPRTAVRAPAGRIAEARATDPLPVSSDLCPPPFVVHPADPASPSEPAGARYVFDATSGSRGACRTRLALGNRGTEVATVTLTFLAAEQDNTSAASVAMVLGPGENLRFADAVHDLFGLEEARGVIEIASDSPARVTTDIDGSGTSPRDPVRAALARRTTLRSPDPESTAVYDVVVLNPGAAELTVALSLAGSTDRPPETVFALVAPHGFLRRGIERLFPSAVSRSDERLSIDIDAGSDAVIAFSLARNASAPLPARANLREP